MKNDYTLGQWIWQWYRLYKMPYLSAEQRNLYERRFVLHIPPDLFNKRLIEVTALDIDIALNELGRTATALYMYNIYYQSLKRAYLLKFIENDESVIITRVRYRGNNGKALTDEEITYLFDSLPKNSDVSKFFKFLLLTGCRKSEALNVRVYDIDFAQRLLHIRGTKTANSDRYIPITDSLLLLLNDLTEKAEDYDKLFYVAKNTYYVTFKKILPNHKLHDLRHTFATRCAYSHIHPAVTQSLLGHSNPQFTLKVYTHIDTRKAIGDLSTMHNSLKI